MKEIKFTESGAGRMDRLMTDLRTDIEEALIARKYVPGEDFVEVTASDIEELSRSMIFGFRTRSMRRRDTRYLLLSLYTIGGALMTIVGLIYPSLQKLIAGEPIRAALVVSGIVFVLFSALMYVYLRRRDAERAMWEDEHFRGGGA